MPSNPLIAKRLLNSLLEIAIAIFERLGKTLGADGGIFFIKLKDARHRDKVLELLSPFNLIHFNDKCHEDDHVDWMNNNSKYNTIDYIYSYYGSFIDGGFEELELVIKYPEDEKVNLTFEELYMDLLTRPEWERDDWSRTSLEKIVHNALYWQYNYDNAIKSLGVLKNMKVGDWIKDLSNKIDSIFSVETWT